MTPDPLHGPIRRDLESGSKLDLGPEVLGAIAQVLLMAALFWALGYC